MSMNLKKKLDIMGKHVETIKTNENTENEYLNEKFSKLD